ncbi:hypothetical protein Bca101_018036 [Brassica carinata]
MDHFLRFIILLAIVTNAVTIKSSDGEDVNCIDIKKQPAFENILLKNHVLQAWPSEIPKPIGTFQKDKRQTFEAHVSTAMCPEGTVSIRAGNDTVSRRTEPDRTNYTPGHEYAIMVMKTQQKLYGTKSTINVWNPAIEDEAKEMSISQIWISSGGYDYGNLNTIEVGLQNNAYKTGCYNVRCPGFIQTSGNIVIGGAISQVSSFGSSQYEITVNVWKDRNSGNWWLCLNNELVGYWPAELFTSLADHAESIEWGGEIVNSQSFGRHTKTQMGSGHFPDEGFGKSSYFRNLEVVYDNNSLQSIQNLKSITTNPECYKIKDLRTREWDTHFFFGGPGFGHADSGAKKSKLRSEVQKQSDA